MDDLKYFCYVDESGDPGNPIDKNGNLKLRSSLVYTVGGILIDEENKLKMEESHKNLISKYFPEMKTPFNFYFHFNELRQNCSPYNKLSKKQQLMLINDIFDIIKNTRCVLFSTTLDLKKHYENYTLPFNPQTYTLTLFLERLVSYLWKINFDEVSVIYERFSRSLRDRCIYDYKKINSDTSFRSKLNMPKLFTEFENGDPCKEVILQFADFWAYIPYSKKTSKIVFDSFYVNFKENSMYKGKDGNYFIN